MQHCDGKMGSIGDLENWCRQMYEGGQRSPYLLTFIIDLMEDKMEREPDLRPTVLSHCLEVCKYIKCAVFHQPFHSTAFSRNQILYGRSFTLLQNDNPVLFDASKHIALGEACLHYTHSCAHSYSCILFTSRFASLLPRNTIRSGESTGGT